MVQIDDYHSVWPFRRGHSFQPIVIGAHGAHSHSVWPEIIDSGPLVHRRMSEHNRYGLANRYLWLFMASNGTTKKYRVIAVVARGHPDCLLLSVFGDFREEHQKPSTFPHSLLFSDIMFGATKKKPKKTTTDFVFYFAYAFAGFCGRSGFNDNPSSISRWWNVVYNSFALVAVAFSANQYVSNGVFVM